MKFALTAMVGAAGALCACTDYYGQPPPPGPPPGVPAAAVAPMSRSCFHTHDIGNHQIADDHTMFIRVLNRDVYALEMAGSCLAGVTSTDPIIIREPPGRPYACSAIDLDISVSRGGLEHGIATPCIVRSMRQLTPAEVAALPPKLRP